jgi:hypothetical protein
MGGLVVVVSPELPHPASAQDRTLAVKMETATRVKDEQEERRMEEITEVLAVIGLGQVNETDGGEKGAHVPS